MNTDKINIKPRTNRACSSAEPERGKPRLALVIIVLLAVVVSWFWLARDPATHETLTKMTASIPGMNSIREGFETVTAKVHDLMNEHTGNKSPAVPYIGATNGSALPGAPAHLSPMPATATAPQGSEGASVTGRIAGVPTETEPQETAGGATERGPVTAAASGLIPPDAGRQDDAVVRVTFIDDLAEWMVEEYEPSNKGQGRINASLQGANLRYGVGMKGLAWVGDDLPKGRSAALAYVFTPDMLNGLYRLYVGRFMEAMNRAVDAHPAQVKPLTATQKKDLFQTYARRFRAISGALQGVGGLDDLTRRVDRVKAAAQQVITANARYSERMFAQDEAREKGQKARLESLGQQVNAAGEAYQQAVLNREKARNTFVQSLRQTPAARGLDEESLLYVAFWVDRRVRESPDKIDAALQAATLFLDLAQRFEQTAGVLP